MSKTVYGKFKIPDREELKKIADGIDLSMDDLDAMAKADADKAHKIHEAANVTPVEVELIQALGLAVTEYAVNFIGKAQGAGFVKNMHRGTELMAVTFERLAITLRDSLFVAKKFDERVEAQEKGGEPQ